MTSRRTVANPAFTFTRLLACGMEPVPMLGVTIVETRVHLRRKEKPSLGIAWIDPS